MNQKQDPVEFYVQKNIMCPQHQQIIRWLNLNENDEIETRLYCNQCIVPQNDKIFEYSMVFQKLREEWENKTTLQSINAFIDGKQIIMKQLEIIEVKLTKLHNFYLDQLSNYYQHSIFSPDQNWSYQELKQLSIDLSKMLIMKNDTISFCKNQEPNEEAIFKINQCIESVQICTIEIANFLQLDDPCLYYEMLQAPQIPMVFEELQQVKYKQVVEKSFPLQISAISMNLIRKQIALAFTDNKNFSTLELWNLQSESQFQKSYSLLTQNHKLLYLNFQSKNLISMDEKQQLIFWYFPSFNHSIYLQKGREFDIQMESITCFEFHNFKCLFVIGGSELQFWKLSNSENLNIINLMENMMGKNEHVSCVNFNQTGLKLVSGHSNGRILIFGEVQQTWELIQELKINSPVREIGFITLSDFRVYTINNELTTQQFTEDIQEYEFRNQRFDNMDQAIYVSELALMINPIIKKGNENTNITRQSINIYDFNHGFSYLAVCEKNLLKIYTKLSR